MIGSNVGNVVWRIGLLGLVVMGLGAGPAWASGKATVDTAVAAARHGNKPVSVVLKVEPGRQAEVAAALTAMKVAVDAELPGSAAFVVTLHPKTIDAVLQVPGVLGLSANAVLGAAGAKSKTSATLTTTTSSTTTTTAAWLDWSTSLQQSATLRGSLGIQWTGLTGAGIGVAIVDSGIDGSAAEFTDRISAFYDFTNGGRRATPTDDYGHGTHIAGLIGASSSLFSGIAPKVHFVGVKVLDAKGQGLTSHLVAALDFLVANKRRLDVQIINLSLGHPILEPAATDPLVQAVERAVAAGYVVVTSAGNYGQNPETGLSGYAGITSPGNAPSAITAGSLDLHGTADRRDDTVSPFSSRGPTWYDGLVKPDLLAPGHGLFSVKADGSTLAAGDTAKLSASGADIKLFGTSMAAATTTGVVALALEANRTAFPEAGRDLPANAIKALLQFSAVSLVDAAASAEYDLLTQGAGGLNAAGAIALATALDPAATVGGRWLVSPVTESSRLGGVTVPWARRIIWGATPLYGEAVYTNAPAWQTNIVWGNTLIWGETLIWGDTLIWGENAVTANTLIWGDSIVWGEGLVTIDGQTLIWGDTLIWGEALIWGDALIWGAAVPQP